MGYYLNSTAALSLYESEVDSPYFIDKTDFLRKLFPLVKSGNKHICITRPRRFGKSVMAAMVAAFFGKGTDSSSIFGSLNIAKHLPENSDSPFENINRMDYRKYMNQYHVIYINFIEPANESNGYQQFITFIKENLRDDLREAFPDVMFRKTGTVTQDLRMVYEQTKMKFILVFDKWDCIFHKLTLQMQTGKVILTGLPQ